MFARLGFTPHVAQNTTNRRSAIDGRTTRHAGYAVSQRIRKRVEEPFGWIKTIGGGRKVRYIGTTTQPGLVQDRSRRLQPHPNHRPRRRHRLTSRPRHPERVRGRPKTESRSVERQAAHRRHRTLKGPNFSTLLEHFVLLVFMRDPKAHFARNGIPEPNINMGGLASIYESAGIAIDNLDLVRKDLTDRGLADGNSWNTVMTANGAWAPRTTDLGNQLLDFVTVIDAEQTAE